MVWSFKKNSIVYMVIKCGKYFNIDTVVLLFHFNTKMYTKITVCSLVNTFSLQLYMKKFCLHKACVGVRVNVDASWGLGEDFCPSSTPLLSPMATVLCAFPHASMHLSAKS